MVIIKIIFYFFIYFCFTTYGFWLLKVGRESKIPYSFAEDLKHFFRLRNSYSVEEIDEETPPRKINAYFMILAGQVFALFIIAKEVYQIDMSEPPF